MTDQKTKRARLVILSGGKRVPPQSVDFIQVSDYHLAEFKKRQKQQENDT